MLRSLHSEFIDAIMQKFKVLEIIDLFAYDENLNALCQKLQSLKKEVYNPDERIIFLHFDTDFYLTALTPGFLILNLHMILTKLDIPFYFTVLVTNHYGINDQLTTARYMYAQHELKNLPVIETNFQQLLVSDGTAIRPIELNSKKINFNYSCLNGSDRSHRKLLMALLIKNQIVSKGVVSYHVRS